MTPRFIIGFAWLFLLQLVISPTTYAQQTITVSADKTELTATLDTTKESSIDNAYPGMTVTFKPITLKNTSPTPVNVSVVLTAQNFELEQLTYLTKDGEAQTFALGAKSSNQVQLQAKLKKSLGNEYQNQTLKVPVTFYLTANKDLAPANDFLLPRTNESKLTLTTLLGIVLLSTLIYYKKQKNRE